MENYQLLKQFKFKHSAQANEKALLKENTIVLLFNRKTYPYEYSRGSL